MRNSPQDASYHQDHYLFSRGLVLEFGTHQKRRCLRLGAMKVGCNILLGCWRRLVKGYTATLQIRP